jgi:hypothetical protein
MYARYLFAILAFLFALGPSAAFAGLPFWCRAILPGHAFDTTPVVTGYYPNTSAVAYPGNPAAAPGSPGYNGSLVLVVGNNFGPAPGSVIMNISNYAGTPMKVPMTIALWSDTLIVGNIPPITGVLATNVAFEVINDCGKSNLPVCTPTPDAPCPANPWQVQFVPFMDMQQIPAANVSCSETSNNTGDSCMNGQPRFPSECTGLSSGAFPGTGIFYGIHNSGWGNGNHGTDSFAANLQNTWTVQSVNSFYWDAVYEGGNPNASLSYSGPPSPNWSATWSEGYCTALGYSGSVTITGPVGVPF